MNRSLLLALSVCAASWCVASGAQDLNRIQPAPVPPVQPPAAPENNTQSGANGGAVLMTQVKGLVFISSLDQLAHSPGEASLDTSRVPLLDDPEFRQRISPYLGQPLQQSGLRRLLATVNLFYSMHDKPFVNVSAPEQDVTDGVLRVMVIEGRLDRVRVEGNRWFSDDIYLNAMALNAGDPLLKSHIDADIDWINRNPFRGATVVAVPGRSFGSTDLVVRANERFPLRVYATADNSGSKNTGRERLGVGANWGNAFGVGHQLNYQFTGSTDFDRSIGHSGSYVIPLPWRHLFTVSGAWSRINADMPADFDSEGKSWQTSLRYEVPFAATANGVTQSFLIGADFKESDNNLEFGGIPVTDNTTNIAQAVLSYRVNGSDRFGNTGFSATLAYSPGSLGGRNETEFFQTSRWGAEADYTYARFDLDRVTVLPKDFSWRTSVSLQLASGNLLGSEQLGLSGSYGVRGFMENDAFADTGYLLRNELLFPTLTFTAIDTRLQPMAFYDYGVGANKRLLPGERERTTYSGAGLGARLVIGRGQEIRFAYGWQLHALPGERHGDQAHVRMMFSY